MSGRVTRRSRQVGISFLLVAAIGWGLNWPVMKVILREWPPLSARGAAGIAAAIGLALVAAASREKLRVPRSAVPRLAAAAMLNVFAFMGFSTLALLWLSVAEAALLVYTMPIWAALLAWPIRGERPTALHIAALALGVAGLTVLFGGELRMEAGKMFGVLLCLGAAILFALGTVAWRAPLPLPPIASTAWQVGLGCLPMIGLGLAFESPAFGALSAAGWAGMAYMTAVPMALCYLAWFAALRRLRPAAAAAGTLLVPSIGIIAAAVMVGESFGVKEFVALVLTMGGVALALRRP